MRRRIVHRGLALLAVAAALALAGARPAAAAPAAAEPPGLVARGWHWLAALWDLPSATQAPEAQAVTLTASPNKSQDLSPGIRIIPGDKGLGVDPNGNP
jgi:hypothetical protein